jgi:hypothetical protein
VALASSDLAWQAEGRGARVAGRLDLEFDYHLVVAELSVDAGAIAPQVRFHFRQQSADGETVESELTLISRVAADDVLRDLVRVAEIVFPADAKGRRRPEQRADTVVLPNPVWGWLRRTVAGAPLTDYHGAYGTQAVWLASRADAPLNLLIESEVVPLGGGAALAEFSPPLWLAPVESATGRHLLRLAPGETAAAKVPLFVRPEVLPGDYERRFRIYLLGSSRPLAEARVPLSVEGADPLVSAVALAAMVLAPVALLAAATFGRRVARRIGVEGLATIGMVAGLHFVVSYASRLAGYVLGGLLGPFQIFVAGLGNELAASLLLAVAVTLVPRVGTFTISSLTVFLLNALFTGQFGLVDVLFVTASAVLGEGALALMGATTSDRLARPSARVPWDGAARVALAVGTANAAALFVQFCLVQVLYRLHFADWYVAAVALVTGLLYGTAGGAWGAAFGFRLRRTVR